MSERPSRRVVLGGRGGDTGVPLPDGHGGLVDGGMSTGRPMTFPPGFELPA